MAIRSLMEIGESLRRDSVGQQAYRALRLALLRGDLQPGPLYSESFVAELLATSRTPVREALRQLEFEGLVEIFPQRGFRFRSISVVEIEEFYALRELLELYVVRTLCDAGTDGSLDSAIGEADHILELQQRSVNDEVEFLAWDEEFHLYLANLANRPRAARMILSLRGILWLLGTKLIGTHARRAAVLVEHRRIVEALLAHDTEASVAAMTAHIRETSRLALADVRTKRGLGEAASDGGSDRD